MRLHVLFRSCSRVYSLHGNKRFINASKSEIIQRCLKSLLTSLSAVAGPYSTEVHLAVFDDHSDAECVAGMQRLLSQCNFSTQFIPLKEPGNGPSLLAHYNYAREHGQDLIYFVEDDYLHSPEAIREMLGAYQQFSFFFDHDVVLYPCDEPQDYLTMKPTQVLVSDTRHWRGIAHTTATMMLSKKLFLAHWEKFMALTHYTPFNDVHEKNTIDLMYQTVPCLSPMPALAVHIVDKNMPPVVDWIAWWNQSALSARRAGFSIGRYFRGANAAISASDSARVNPNNSAT